MNRQFPLTCRQSLWLLMLSNGGDGLCYKPWLHWLRTGIHLPVTFSKSGFVTSLTADTRFHEIRHLDKLSSLKSAIAKQIVRPIWHLVFLGHQRSTVFDYERDLRRRSTCTVPQRHSLQLMHISVRGTDTASLADSQCSRLFGRRRISHMQRLAGNGDATGPGEATVPGTARPEQRRTNGGVNWLTVPTDGRTAPRRCQTSHTHAHTRRRTRGIVTASQNLTTFNITDPE